MPVKKSILALALAGILALSGCSSLLERDYIHMTPYEPFSSSNAGGSSLRVENYQDLLNAVLYLVSQGAEHGVLNLYNYTAQDVEADLARACLEVVQEDPLGAYAVDYIKHDHSLIVSYYEVNIHIAYRRTADQLSSITSVTGSSALRQEFRRALISFSPQTTLRIGYFTEDEDYIRELVEQAYYDAPAAALGMPEFTVSLYPNSGYQRIVEVNFTYHDTYERLLQHSQALKELAALLVPKNPTAETLRDVLLSMTILEEDDVHSTAYDALVHGLANSEGAALGYQLLCDQAGLTCTVVRGQLNGAEHFWNLISEDGSTFRHVDLSAGLFSLTDDELTRADGYEWDLTAYPAAIDPAAETTPSPSPEQDITE